MASPPARVTAQVAVQSPSRLLRDTLCACLDVRPDVTVVGMVAEPDQMPALCELRRPDVVIFDAGLRLSEISGPVGNLMRRFPELNVIVTYRNATGRALRRSCLSRTGWRPCSLWCGAKADAMPGPRQAA
jgi:DNA-binding NarL/FixJ family response regulator